jgi:hypothetical protein
MKLEKQLPEVLVNTRWADDHLIDPKVRIVEVDYDSSSGIEMKREQIKKTSTIFFAIVTVTALFAVTLITASQNAAAVAKGHTVSGGTSRSTSTVKVHHKHHTASAAVISETHSIPTTVVVHHKGHTVSGGTSSSASTVVGGMIVCGY